MSENDLQERLSALEERMTDRVDDLGRELRELVDRRIGELREILDVDPEERTRALVTYAAEGVRRELEQTIAEAARLREGTGALQKAQEALTARLSGGGDPPPWRTNARFNVVYRAEVPSYIAVYFVGGRTDRVSLLIGDDDPPAKSYGELDVSAETTSFIGALVRPGEHWMARAKRGTGSVKCVVTTLY
ncbi:hypothetical protein [Actinocorallia longicatena]|uniref:Uncharacterized protein n=1 Tax=Actinocorallia longicatena TaxID=111803 RepID=A0ABP6QDG8_9ACTN